MALGIGITDGKLIYCHGVAEGNVDKKISTLEYKNRRVYDCFSGSFTDEFGSPDLYIPPITIYDIPHPYRRARYNPDLLPAAISIASGNYDSTLNTPSDLTDLLPSDDTNTLHVRNKYVHFQGRTNIGYCCRKHGQKICYKRQGYIAPHDLIITRKFILVIGFPGLFQIQGLDYWNINSLCKNFSAYCCVCIPYIL